jgi:hypothetical protein
MKLKEILEKSCVFNDDVFKPDAEAELQVEKYFG